ncbi:MAG: 50S ribosomal protein L23 [Candidatus Margulisiibacteriota bacterium]
MHPEQIILAPVVTEKAIGARSASQYVFKVHLDANKKEIEGAIKKLFKVNVVSVNTCKVRAKTRVRGPIIGHTSKWKKAYVTLAAGQKIEELEV